MYKPSLTQGSPRPKYGMLVASFPTQTETDVTYTLDVACDNSNFDFQAYQTALNDQAPNHKLIGISQYVSNENKAWVRYTFSKLPGASLIGSVVNASTLGSVGTRTVQAVATGTAPSTGFLVVDSSVIPQDKQVAQLITTTVTAWPTQYQQRYNDRGELIIGTVTREHPQSSLPAVGLNTETVSEQVENQDRVIRTVEEASERIEITAPLLSDEGFAATISKQNVATNTTVADSLRTISVRATPINAARCDLEIVTLDADPQPLSGTEIGPKMTLVDVTRQTVAPSTAAVPGFGVISDSVRQISEARAIRERKVLHDGVYPTLTGQIQVSQNRILARHISAVTRTITSHIVPAGTSAPAGFLVTESSITPEDQFHSNYYTEIVSEFKTLTSYQYSDRFYGALLTITEEIVPTGTRPTPRSSSVVESECEAIDTYRMLRRTTTLDGGTGSIPILRGYDSDEITLAGINETIQIVPAGTIAKSEIGTLRRVDPIDGFHSRLITRVLSLPSEYQEDETISISVPAIFLGLKHYNGLASDGSQLLDLIEADIISGGHVEVIARVEVSFSRTKPKAPTGGVVTFYEVELNKPGLGGRALTDGQRVTYSYNGINVNENLRRSFPTASEWLRIQGTERLVRYISRRIRGGFYEIRKYWATIPTIPR